MTKARTLADNFAADINGITAGTGITGGGTSGTVTITNSMATAIDAKADLIVGTGADTFSRLAVASTAGYILSVDSAAATGLKWAAPAGGGKVLQVVQGTTTTLTSTTSLTYADTNLSASITPSLASSKIAIFVTGAVENNSAGAVGGVRLMRGATSIYEWSNRIQNEGGYLSVGMAINYVDSPATTSATTYKIQINENGTGTFNWSMGSTISSIVLMEIGA